MLRHERETFRASIMDEVRQEINKAMQKVLAKIEKVEEKTAIVEPVTVKKSKKA